jgi:phosphotransferase system enzyme I (PtsP)
VLFDCIAELKADGIPCQDKPKVGCMVELPAAVSIIDELAKETDFLCIGTNDLIQYMLAVDRTNESVSDLYVSHHPAVLRALKAIATAARENKTDVSLCGDMAADPAMLPFLIGIGLQKFSMDPRMIPNVQKTIETIDVSEAKKIADTVLGMGLISEVGAFLGIDKG